MNGNGKEATMDYPSYPAGNDPEVVDHFLRTRLALAAVVAVTAAGYLTLVGWHQQEVYQTWKVWTLAGVLAVLAVWSGWIGGGASGSTSQVVALTVLWSADAATDPHVIGANMWPAGALLLAIGAAAGAFTLSALATGLRTQCGGVCPTVVRLISPPCTRRGMRTRSCAGTEVSAGWLRSGACSQAS